MYNLRVFLSIEVIHFSNVLSQVLVPGKLKLHRFYIVWCLDFLENSPKETIENGVDAESILRYRERCLNENQSLIECDLRILQRMIAIDPANKNIFVKNLTFIGILYNIYMNGTMLNCLSSSV